MIDTPKIVQTETLLTATIHLHVTLEEMQKAMGPGVEEIMSTIAAQGVAPVGPMFTHHFRRPTDTFDFEICVPVTAPISPVGRVQLGVWPAMEVARTVYRGNYDGLAGAWGEFAAWLEAQGHKPAEDLWERYIEGPHTHPDPASWLTELNRPLMH